MTGTPVSSSAVETPVVAAVAAAAALATPGVVRLEPGIRGLVGTLVRAGRQRFLGVDPASSEGVRVRRDSAGALTVDIDVTVTIKCQAAEVGRAIQERVARLVSEQTGETVDAVSVAILDIEPEA